MLKLVTAAALAASSVPSIAADRVVVLPSSSLFAGTIRLGEATGGPTVRAAVAPEIASIVFKDSRIGDEKVGYWFGRKFKPALRSNGMLAKKPEAATYELTAEVRDLQIEPTAGGSHHKSHVLFSLREVAGGRQIWSRELPTDIDVTRGIRFGEMGRAMGVAAGGALTGQRPATTAAIINQQGGPRSIDVMIDILEGISEGFEAMARTVVTDVAATTALR